MITIQNIAGGDRQTFRTVAALARHVAKGAPFGGYEIVSFTGLDGMSRDDASAVIRWAESETKYFGRVPKNKDDWERIALRAIQFDRQGEDER